jgi:hypothetical protein
MAQNTNGPTEPHEASPDANWLRQQYAPEKPKDAELPDDELPDEVTTAEGYSTEAPTKPTAEELDTINFGEK